MGCAPSSGEGNKTQIKEKVSDEKVRSPPKRAEEKPVITVEEPRREEKKVPSRHEVVIEEAEEDAMDGPVTQDEKKTVLEKAGLTPSTLSFDSQFALEQVDDDLDFLIELKDSVVELQDESSKSLPEALAEKNWTAMFEKAHALKGAVANLGMERLRLLALSLEQTGRVLHMQKEDPQFTERELFVLISLMHDEWAVFHETFDKEVEKIRGN